LSIKSLDVKLLFLIGGIEGVVGGLLGVGAFYWDYFTHLFYTPMEDIAFMILFVITIVVGGYLLRSKRTVPTLDMSTKYAGSY